MAAPRYLSFAAWRRAERPRLRRSRPVGITHSGSTQSVLACLCGAQVTYATKWRVPKRVLHWEAEHNRSCWPAGVPRP